MRGAGPFVEVADRVFHGRYRQWDVGVGLVVGSEAALVVDTRASEVQGREVFEDIGRMRLGVPVTTVVTTHVHFDHTFGNRAFETATVIAHERVAATFVTDAERIKRRVRDDLADAPEYGYTVQDLHDLLDTEPRGPDVTVEERYTVDLGDRVVELAFAGRGHTDGDIRIAVPHDKVVFLGDLIEESAPPSLGGDSWPLDWAPTLDRHLAAVGPEVLVVPGHGRPVDAAFVRRQRDELAAVAAVIRDRYVGGIPLLQARQEPDGRLPYPLEGLANAFTRGYTQSAAEA